MPNASCPHAVTEASFKQLFDRAQSLCRQGSRAILGLTGAPGAGKSTLAEQLVAALGPERAVLVSMDGFHYANSVLDDLDRRERKGAPDTFDAWGYVSLLRRIRAQGTPAGAAEGTVYAPRFRRDLEEPIGSAIAVHPDIPLVITEGNYLLHDAHPWSVVRDLLAKTWFLAPTEEQRLAWLIDRHVRYGRSPAAAREWSLGSDQRNAELIQATATRADLVVRLKLD